MRRLQAEFRLKYLISGRITGIHQLPIFSFYRLSGKFAIRHIHNLQPLMSNEVGVVFDQFEAGIADRMLFQIFRGSF